MGTETNKSLPNGTPLDSSGCFADPKGSMRDSRRGSGGTGSGEQQDVFEIPEQQQVQLSDFIGEHGAYQLAITVLLFIRNIFLGLMANSGPLMTPDVTFYCSLPMTEVFSIMPNISNLSPREQELEIREEFKQVCQIDLHLYQNQSQFNESASFRTSPLDKIGNLNFNFTSSPVNQSTRIRECVDFTYDIAQDQGRTMTSEFDLVCDRDWLRSLFQSLVPAAIVVAHVFWGTFSDKYGRFQAQRLCLVVSLFSGLISIFATDFWTFTAARSVCSFGDLGLVVSQTTIVVELVGQRYRGMSVALVNFGFALGVSLLPYIIAYFEDFRHVIGFTVLCHMVTMPFILATKESPRWLLTNMKFKEARRELKRIVRWNRASNSFCQSLWTLSLFGKPEVGDKTRKENLKKIKKQNLNEQRQTFNLLFSKFIDQIESQNLYDPVADAIANSMTPQANLSSIPPSPRPVIVQPAHGQRHDRPIPPLFNYRTSPKSSSHKRCSLNVPPHLDPKVSRDQTRSERQTLQLPLIETLNEGREGKVCIDNNDITTFIDSQSLRRAISCDRLDANSTVSQDSLNDDNKSDKDNLQQQLKSKTITLPVIIQANSVYNDEEDNDEYFSPPIRRIRRVDGNNEQQMDCTTSCHIVANQLSFVGRVSRLFKDKKLMIAVFTIVWTTFNSELLYSSFIIINLEAGEDVYLNYVLGGCMEALAAISASLLLSYSPRRVSLIAFWLLISISCFGLSLAHIDSTWAVWLLALAKFSQSTLSSIASVAAYESFPTFLRQSGSGLVFTLGMMGSVFAPLIFAEYDDHAGMDRVLMTFSLSSLVAASLIYLCLNETRGCELK